MGLGWVGVVCDALVGLVLCVTHRLVLVHGVGVKLCVTHRLGSCFVCRLGIVHRDLKVIGRPSKTLQHAGGESF